MAAPFGFQEDPLRYALPLAIGLIGVVILVSLGSWQLRRLAWKEGVLAEIEARISAEPVALPAAPDPEADRYLPVRATGETTGEALHVLISGKTFGAAYRIITGFGTEDGRRIMVDLGYRPADEKPEADPVLALEVTGNLHWPDEVDGFTPEPDTEKNIWFARDVGRMAEALGTEPVLLIARSVDGDSPAVPLAVGTEGIPNDHLGYAIQWFGLAIVWAAMSGLWVWRMAKSRKRTDEA